MRFHLIDRIEEVRYNEYITAVKCVSLSDDVFDEHFPGQPVYPGSLIIEALAQLGGSFFELIMKHEGKDQRQSLLSIVNRMKFRRPVFPGDRMQLRAEMVSLREEFGVVAVRSEVDGEVCAEGELTFTFMAIHDESLHDSRLELYKICMKNTRELS
jgi:3-hydroxymyristoyl/3-hydroxydecanoyl-(acyl carrier protein) dehydratase